MLLHSLGLRENDPREERLFATSRPVPLGDPSNTYSMVGTVYADFGMAGVFLYPYIIGVLTTWVFLLYRQHGRLWHIVAGGFFYPYLLFTVQGDQLSSPPFNIALLLAVVLAVRMNRVAAKEKCNRAVNRQMIAQREFSMRS